jgi:hypothetical protein
MTICLGAVWARSVQAPRTEFEHEVPKVTQIGEPTVALAAGDALRGVQLSNEVRCYVQQGAQPLQNVAATAAVQYAALRRPAGASCRTAPTPLCDGAPRRPTTEIER